MPRVEDFKATRQGFLDSPSSNAALSRHRLRQSGKTFLAAPSRARINRISAKQAIADLRKFLQKDPPITSAPSTVRPSLFQDGGPTIRPQALKASNLTQQAHQLQTGEDPENPNYCRVIDWTWLLRATARCRKDYKKKYSQRREGDTESDSRSHSRRIISSK